MQPKFYNLSDAVTVGADEYRQLVESKYRGNDSLALILPGLNGADDVTISVNIPQHLLGVDEFFLNVNAAWAVTAAQGLNSLGIISPTGRLEPSGYVDYPVYKFDRSQVS